MPGICMKSSPTLTGYCIFANYDMAIYYDYVFLFLNITLSLCVWCTAHRV